MDTALPQIIPFILDRNLAKANCTGNHVCTSCDTVVLDYTDLYYIRYAQYRKASYSSAFIIKTKENVLLFYCAIVRPIRSLFVSTKAMLEFCVVYSRWKIM